MSDNTKKYLVFAAQGILGIIFFVMGGLNGFFHFMEPPTPSESAGAFMGAMAATGYFFPLVKSIELVGGGLLLVNRFVPFALVLLAPIIVGIFTLHLFLDPGGMGISVLTVVLEVFLAVMYRDNYKGMFAMKATPA